MVDYEKLDGDNEDICEAIVNNLYSELRQLIMVTESDGIEHGIAIAHQGDTMKATDDLAGEENEISGYIMNNLHMDALQLIDGFNVNEGNIYTVHTHPSGHAAMSARDLLSACQGLERHSPITGSFVMASIGDSRVLNGVVMPKDLSDDEIEELISKVKHYKQLADEGQMPLMDARQDMKHIMKEFGAEFCSYRGDFA